VFDFSPVQIIIVLVIALLIFGPKRLPDMGRNLGRGLRDFKSGIAGEDPTPMRLAHPVPAAAEPTAEELIKEAANQGD